eukprot:1157875-Pelagomonas_calceolata.AAC.1
MPGLCCRYCRDADVYVTDFKAANQRIDAICKCSTLAAATACNFDAHRQELQPTPLTYKDGSFKNGVLFMEDASEEVQREWVRYTRKVDKKLEDAVRHMVKRSLQRVAHAFALHALCYQHVAAAASACALQAYPCKLPVTMYVRCLTFGCLPCAADIPLVQCIPLCAGCFPDLLQLLHDDNKMDVQPLSQAAVKREVKPLFQPFGDVLGLCALPLMCWLCAGPVPAPQWRQENGGAAPFPRYHCAGGEKREGSGH